jgi:anti-sigma regulatory factor (Ser/Thr protein kinase)
MRATTTKKKRALGRIGGAGAAEDLRVAKLLQERLLPADLPKAQGYSFSIQFIKNDFAPGMGYDAVRLDDDEIAFYAFNASGSNVAAAYGSAMAHMAFHHHLKAEKTPAQSFREINVSFTRHLKTLQYLTGFLGVIDLRTNTLRYCNAHYGAACLLSAKTGEITALEKGGGFLGIFPEAEFSEGRVTLTPGDKVLLLLDSCGTESSPGAAGFGLFMNRQSPTGLNLRSVEKRAGACREPFALLSCELHQEPRKLTYLELCGLTESANLRIKTLHDFDQMKEHIRYLMAETDKIGYPLRFQKNFRLVLLELITNAIIHGNKYDREKRCIVLTDITPQQVQLAVIDEGKGYDISAIPDPLHPENINKPHGRGLFIVKHYVDDFRLRGAGNCTVVTFSRGKE